MPQSKKILHIDDDVLHQRLVHEILTEKQFSVYTAGDAAEGYEMLERLRPKLVILDIQMPDIDGYTLCRRLRQEEMWAKLPVLMLSVYRSPEEWRLGFEAGATDYLTKPIDGDVLIERGEYWMAGHFDQAEPSENSELLMVRAVIAGNRGAFDVLVRQYKEILFRNILRKCRDIPEA